MFGNQAIAIPFYVFEIVVQKSQDSQPNRDKVKDEDIDIGEIVPKKRREQEPSDDYHSPHRRRSLFGAMLWDMRADAFNGFDFLENPYRPRSH